MEQQKYSALLSELISGQCSNCYWARKSRMRALELELSPLDLKLLEFDVAFKFNDAKDLASSAEKIFQADKSNERVRQRIGQLFSALLNSRDSQFSTELVSHLSMETLQEMFFFAFPEQRNSTKGSLQVYLTLASNRPQTLDSIATKLFAYYLGASAEFQRGQKPNEEERITPMDAVLFHLFDSLVQARFGDLSVHNLSQLFQVLLQNCFADSMDRVPVDFYRQSGIPCLANIDRPSTSWHFCLPVLAKLFQLQNKPQLATALEPFPQCSSEVGLAIERALANPIVGPQLANSVEFVRLALHWAMASPLGRAQTEVANQLVWLPAHFFWVDPDGLQHYWVYNLDAEQEDSPAEIEEPQCERTPGICTTLLHPIRLLNSLFSAGPIAERELAKLAAPNVQSIAVLTLMVSENWKRAADLLSQFNSQSAPVNVEASTHHHQRSILRFQQLQTLIVLRKLDQAFQLGVQLLAEFALDQQQNDAIAAGTEFPALVVSQEPSWVQLEGNSAHLGLYLQLLLFHICWLGFARCQSDSSPKMEAKADLLFMALLLVAQSCWEEVGFGLYQQLAEHVANKERFRCPDLLSRLNNQVLLGHLLGLDHVLMNFSSPTAPSNPSENFQSPTQICQDIMQGKVHLAGEVSALSILKDFLTENLQKIVELLASLFS